MNQSLQAVSQAPYSDSLKGRMTFVMVGCLIVACALIGRAAVIQIGRDSRLDQMAHRQFRSKLLIQPRRGMILDRTGEPLAINTETQSLAMNPSKIENKRTVARLLARAMDLPYSKTLQRLQEKREFAWIKRHLTDFDLTRLKRWRLIGSDGEPISGLWLVRESRRVYPHGELAAHVMGDVNLDSDGKEGIELLMNERLRGKVVSMSAVRDALGRPAFIDSVAAKAATEGRDGEPVTLTLDASLQFSVEEELRNAVRKANAKGGTVIVMNAANGEILAMANEPSFNPNDRSVAADRRRNRAVTDGYEPGSTMKAVLLASALNKGMKLTDSLYGEHGSFKIQGRTISEAEAHERFEWVSLKKMIQVSSNVVAAKLALKVGADQYSTMLKNFGFGSRTDLDFPGEIPGRVPPRKSWQPLGLANMGFGQGLLVTPLQMARAYAAFANGGWLVQPTLLKNPAGKTMPPKRILSEKVAAHVVEALESVMQEGGTGVKANVLGYKLAGKTGTAQKVDPATGAYSRSKYVASFIGFPIFQGMRENPKIVILTAIDEPRGLYYAADTAVPLFREVFNAVASRFSLPASQIEPAKLLAEAEKGRDVLKSVQSHPAPRPSLPVPTAASIPLEWIGKGSDGRMQWKMPSVQGLSVREAIQRLKGYSFQLELHGQGLVRTQFPEEGKPVSEGETIRLSLDEPHAFTTSR